MIDDQGIRCVRAANPSFMTGTGTNTWVVGTVIIDPGPHDAAHLDAVMAAAPDATHILVTHSHADHSAGADALKGATGATLLAGNKTDGCSPDELLVDGWRTEAAGGFLRAIATPGHASDHFCFSLDAAGILFSGDHIMEGSTVVIAPLDGDMNVYMQGLNRVDGLLLDAICPGHGEVIEDPHGHIKSLITHRRERQQNILDALTWRVDAKASELVDDVYRPLDSERRGVAELQTWAHLRALGDDGAVTSTDRDDLQAVWSVVSS